MRKREAVLSMDWAWLRGIMRSHSSVEFHLVVRGQVVGEYVVSRC